MTLGGVPREQKIVCGVGPRVKKAHTRVVLARDYAVSFKTRFMVYGPWFMVEGLGLGVYGMGVGFGGWC